MSVLNVTLKPLLILITIPITIITFVLFLLVVNVLVLFAAEALIDGFHIASLKWMRHSLDNLPTNQESI